MADDKSVTTRTQKKFHKPYKLRPAEVYVNNDLDACEPKKK